MVPFGKIYLSLSITIFILFGELLVEAEKVIVKAAEAKIELPDQTISEVLIKRIRPSNKSSEVLLHKITISRDPSQNGTLIEIPMSFKQGQPLFISNNSFDVDFDNYVDTNNTENNKTEISGRSAFRGFGRGVPSSGQLPPKETGEVECDDYGDEPNVAEPPTKNCWSREEFDDKMARIRNAVTKNLRPCPETLPCREWSSCLYLWPTGLITEKLSINPDGERKYFNLLLDGIEDGVRKEIRNFMNECYQIYGLHQPFEGQKNGRRRRREDPPKIDIGLRNCRARILDIQECLGYGVWKALCQEEM